MEVHMGRLGMDKQLENGLLSPTTAGEVLGKSANTIRTFFTKHGLARIAVPGTREVRISALDLLRFALKHKIPFSASLFGSARAYARIYETETLELIDKIQAAYLNPRSIPDAEIDKFNSDTPRQEVSSS
jgi:hypothetical protein